MTSITTLNPFGSPSASITSPSVSSAQSADSARAIAEVQAALMIARMNPRDQRVSMDRILNACTRQSLAQSAVYAYSRGGSSITGPSIRLAEAIAQQWGNIQFGIRELSNSGGKSEVQAYAWDVETNTRREISFTVPHIRYTKKGGYSLEDPRDIYELVANQGARRLRACILAVIPGDVVEAAVSQCQVTLRQSVDVSPEGIKKTIDAFEKFGVTKAQIEKFCQCRSEAINAAQIVRLRNVYTSLRDGMSVPADWFDPIEEPVKAVETAEKPKSLKAKLKEKKAAEAQKTEEQPPQEKAPEQTIDEADLPDVGAEPPAATVEDDQSTLDNYWNS